MEKRVLILAYDFPPYTSMGGQRPYSWYKNFRNFNINPTVITRHWPDTFSSKTDYNITFGKEICKEETKLGTIIRVPYKANLRDKILIRFGFKRFALFRRFLSLAYSILQYITFSFDNKSGIYRAAKDILTREKYELIIATGEPFVLFRYAYLLSKQYHIPWIADYRDCWSENFEVIRKGGINKLVHRTVFGHFERKYLNSATAITTAAPIFKNHLNKLFPKLLTEVIYNGIDAINYSNSKEKMNHDKLTIAFAGTIYPFQPLEIFMKGFKLFINSKKDLKIEVIFYGSEYDESQKKRILHYDDFINSYIKLTPRITQKELYSKLKDAHVFLLLENKGMISGKLYEYLSFNKKIILAGRDFGAMEKIITDTNTGIVCENEKEIQFVLSNLYKEWQENGFINCDPKNMERYTRETQTKAFGKFILNRLGEFHEKN